MGYFDKRCSRRPGAPLQPKSIGKPSGHRVEASTRDMNNTQTLYPANEADATQTNRQEAKVAGALFLACIVQTLYTARAVRLAQEISNL